MARTTATVQWRREEVSHLSKTEPGSTETGERLLCDLVHLNKTDSDYYYYFLCEDENSRPAHPEKIAN